MKSTIQESIDATRTEFEKSFAAGKFYNKQTKDAKHLSQIMEFLPIKAGMRILDVGTGSGYLSFPIASAFPDCEIVGLDIVKRALEMNRDRANTEKINNISFICYDGMNFPFEDESFDLVITRYALHHFPNIKHSFGEIARVLKKQGCFFLSDPCPNECDNSRFVDDYMQLKKDGHIKFYTKEEWKNLGIQCKMRLSDSFASSIRFPKKKETAQGIDDILKKHDKQIIESYHYVETDTEIYVTEQVNNLLFIKNDGIGIKKYSN